MIGGSAEPGEMGFLLINAGQVIKTEKMFAALLTLMGAVVMKGQDWLSRKLAPWEGPR